MAQTPFDQLYTRVQGLKAQGADVPDFDKEIAAAGWTPEAYKAQVAAKRGGGAAAAVPFDQLYAKVQAMKAQGADVPDFDRAITAAGMTPDEYKARAAQLRAGVTPGEHEAQAKAAASGSGGFFGGGAIEAGARGFVDAATFGTGDELGGLIEGVHSLLTGGEYGKAYDEAVARRRQGNEAFATAYPGASLGGEVAGGVASGVPVSLAAPVLGTARAGAAVARAVGTGAGARAAGAATRGVIEGGAGGAAYGAGSGDTPYERLKKAALVGAGGAALGGAVGGAAGAVLGGGPGRVGILDASGNLTPEAAAAVRAVKNAIDPDALDTATAGDVARRLGGAGTGEDIAATARTVLGERHGVELAAPQVLRDKAGLGHLYSASTGARGRGAQRLADEFAGRQAAQFGQAATDLEHQAAPGAVLGTREHQAGGRIADAVQSRYVADKAQLRQLYQRTGADRVVIPAADTADLMPRIEAAKQASHFAGVRPERAPALANVLDQLEEDVVGKNVTLDHLDDVRKSIAGMARGGGDPTDARVAGIALGAFDDWVDAAIDRQATVLPGQALEGLKQAREAAKQVFRTYQRNPGNPSDTVGPAVERIRAAAKAGGAEGGLTDQKLFDKLMGGGTGFSANELALAERLRDILGEQHPAWQTFKAGLFRRIMHGDANQQGRTFSPDEQAWKTTGKRIDDALEGRGNDMVRQLLGDEMFTQIKQLREVARSLEIPNRAASWSGTSYATAKEGGAVASRLARAIPAALTAGAGGTFLGGPLVGLGTGLAGAAVEPVARFVGNRANAAQIARLLASHRPVPPGSLPFTMAPAGQGAARLEDWLTQR